MQDRPVVVSNGNNTGILAVVAIVVILAIALFVWQPWNTSGPKSPTTIINQAPAGAGAGGAAGGSSSTTTTK